MSPFHLRGFRAHAVRQLPSLHHEHSSYQWWVLANVMIGTFMAVLDATITNVALPKIMAAFGVSVDKVEWVITAYLLVFAVMLPTSGWVADHFGYKRTYLLALFTFTLGSFLCGLSWNEDALIFFRVIQGMGAGFMMPVGLAIVTREFPPERRGTALGFWAIAAAASVTLGPLAGGYLVDNFSWQTIFDVNVPVGLMGIFATAGQLALTRSYVYAPAARVGPFLYAGPVAAALLDWLIWGVLPDSLFVIGAAIVIVAAILALRLRTTARAADSRPGASGPGPSVSARRA